VEGTEKKGFKSGKKMPNISFVTSNVYIASRQIKKNPQIPNCSILISHLTDPKSIPFLNVISLPLHEFKSGEENYQKQQQQQKKEFPI
jgi:hypothetical protein